MGTLYEPLCGNQDAVQTQPRAVPKLEQAQKELESEVNELINIIGDLREKLRPLLSPDIDSPDKTAEQDKPPAGGSPLVLWVGDNARVVQVARSQLYRLYRYLEL